MKQLVLIILLLWGNFQLILSQGSSARPLMLYGDTSRVGGSLFERSACG